MNHLFNNTKQKLFLCNMRLMLKYLIKIRDKTNKLFRLNKI